MPNDTTLKSVFDYAKGGPLSGGEHPQLPAVFATYVEHWPDFHLTDGKTALTDADLVGYANGPLTLSADKKTLSGEFKLWRNRFNDGFQNPIGGVSIPDDAFADVKGKATIRISVSDSGQATLQKGINHVPIGGMPPELLKATFTNAIFVNVEVDGVRSLSFTLGSKRDA
jgi:hypothetical protein